MNTNYEVFFYIVFTSQILLISWYIPARVRSRVKQVLETYPPSRYPKLYPVSVDTYRLGRWIFKTANNAILLIGLALMASLLFLVDHSGFADDGYISEFWPAAFGFLQFLPYAALEYSECRLLRKMRDLDTSTVREAELRPRKLFDFVPPLGFFVAIILYVVVVVADLVTAKTNGSLALWLTVGYVFMGSLGFWILRGRNLNPHQDRGDRERQISASLTSFVYVSIGMSLFYLFSVADQVYDLDYLDAIFLSIYWQTLAIGTIHFMMQRLSLDDIDFSVYRADRSAGAQG